MARQNSYKLLLLMCLLALVLRLLMFAFIHNPGMDDSLHYYNLGKRLAEGHGFTIDYVWQYLRLYDEIVHPIDYWMPLTGIIAAGSMTIFGINTVAGLLPVILLGALLPLLTFLAARIFRLGDRTALIAAALTIALPELIWQSTRLLTTTPNMWLIGGSILLLVRGMQRGQWWAFALSGILAGLGYLNRTDALLLAPMTVVTLVVYWIWGQEYNRKQWRFLLLMPLTAFLIVLPWTLRNLRVLNQSGMVENSRIFFMVEYNDHHSYDNNRITFQRLLDERTLMQIAGKRAFEFIAAAKQIITSLQPGVILAFTGGILLMFWQRDRSLLLSSAPVLILLLGILITYPLLVPMKAQGGSFRTAFASLIPLLLPFAAYAITQTITKQAYQTAVVVLTVLLSAAVSVDGVRQETALIDSYHVFVRQIVAMLDTLPDVNDDGDVRVMTQDPITLSYYGESSVIVPKGTREDIIAVAQRYHIDYVMLPTAWTDLDQFYGRSQSDDPRFVYTASIARPGRLPAEFYAIMPDQ